MNLLIYRPIVSNSLAQKFGENRACINLNTRKITGMRSGVCPSGTTPFYKSMGMEGHNGLDLGAIHGEKVYHAGVYDGWMRVEKDSQGGIGVDVISNEPLKYIVKSKNGELQEMETYVKLRYWHLKTPIGHDKKQVKLGEIIGLADNTGASSGDHVHFGLKPCTKEGKTLFPGNGYMGCIDPMPYMEIGTDAFQAAQYLSTPAPYPSIQEKKEIVSNISVIRRLLLEIRDLLARL